MCGSVVKPAHRTATGRENPYAWHMPGPDAPTLREALVGLMTIAAMYHKGEAPGDLDACENPDNCGHCLAMRAARSAIEKADPC